jgi:transposase
MTRDSAKLLDHIAELERKLKAEQAARIASEERAAVAESRANGLEAEVETLKLTLAKLRRDKFGASSERGAKLIDQLELQLAELEERIAQDEAAAEIKAPPQNEGSAPSGREKRRKPARRPLPEHLRRERIVHPAPSSCPCCGGPLRKLGEDITETLEHVPAQWKVIQHVREKFSCRKCEAITQPPAPSHPIARGRAGPQLLAQVLFGKYGAHLPLNRQSEIYAKEGIDLDVSTLADWVGASAATLMPLVEATASHVFAAERIHADDTTVPVLAKGKTRTGRVWVYVRDDAPFSGGAPPAAAFYYSPDRGKEHPERHLAGYSGLMQADAYAGFNGLYVAGRKPGPIIEAACWAHGRRKFYELAELRKAPLAIEAVRRIDELFVIEREINGLSADQRLAARRQRSRPLADALETWMRQERRKLSSGNPIAKAMNYSLERWPALTRFLDDGRVCLSNNAAERALRGVALGRRNWTFAGSDSGGRRAAAIYTLVATAKLTDVDPRAWLADVLARIADHPANRIAELLPWNWKAAKLQEQAAAA